MMIKVTLKISDDDKSDSQEVKQTAFVALLDLISKFFLGLAMMIKVTRKFCA